MDTLRRSSFAPPPAASNGRHVVYFRSGDYRTSTALLRSNQIRLYFSSIGYCLLETLAQCTTIRLRLLKIGARIRITARKVWISLATGYAWAGVFAQAYENLERGEPRRC